ncbi:hypothetical protein RIF25_08335 [Thermosynechococcaceae cyanobacterium BACA0444]|uniref:Uncharacterized protein n=1 Tax=Pseudocalidococcus azoricus BACA0444 TaxID=2918990 RepID=A0AAE4JVX5_9CYAN|nr:hypothetical protein [Pseudocalidococcus azoricus]MDS3860820.1 hypothetical protein [Pseudocalidococcus azoricus BACA0444]
MVDSFLTKEMGCKPRTLGRLCYNRDRKSATSPESRTVEWRNLEDQGKQQREGISQRTLGEGKVIGLPAIQGILTLLYTQPTGRGGCQHCIYTTRMTDHLGMPYLMAQFYCYHGGS